MIQPVLTLRLGTRQPLRRILAALLTLYALLVAPTACMPAVAALGGSAQEAVRNSDSLFTAFARRFTSVRRDAKFAHARPLMAKYALIPGRLFGDKSVWSVIDDRDSTRGLAYTGTYRTSAYQFQSVTSAAYPRHVGDQRNYLQLKRLGDDEFDWYSVVDHAVGPIRVSDAGAAMLRLFTGFEGRDADRLRQDTRGAFPRAARHMGQLIAIDSLVTTLGADGATSARYVLRLRPDSIRAQYPNYAAYLLKYVVPSRYRVLLMDRDGTPYMDIDGRDGKCIVRLRARGGRLAPLDGSLRQLPDSLLMRIDFSAKFKIFRVGFTNLVSDFTIERSEHDRAWSWRFRQEPAWHFPLAVDKLIKTPLRRPFQGRGAEFRLGIRDDLGESAMSYRVGRITVQESTIMRWLGGLGASAFSDFADRTEAEENRYLAELFTALVQDLGTFR
ncbi:MAG: hypothetical protein MNPFHGCM_02440 [Gemmatimonadaceae bacterium]|nr:hypothetical protein [Gemmatimonadaceae bacterium]